VNIQVNIREYSREFSDFFAGLRPAAYSGHYQRTSEPSSGEGADVTGAAVGDLSLLLLS